MIYPDNLNVIWLFGSFNLTKTIKMNKLTTIILFFLSFSVFSQSIGIGEWRDELPYREAIAVAESDEIVYGITPYSLFTLRKDNESMNRYSKIDGLSDFGMSALEYNDEKEVLFIAYSNTNIDLVKEGNIINISDIKRKQILGKKTINNIHFIDNIAYLSCGFGIVLVDIDREEVKDTWYIGDDGNALEIFDIANLNGFLYAATEQGIRKAELSNPNLADFQSWEIVTEIPHYDAVFDQIEVHEGRILTNYHPNNNMDEIYVFENEVWTPLTLNSNQRITNICSGDLWFYIIRTYGIDLYNTDLTFERNVYTYSFTSSTYPTDVSEDSDGSIWLSDRVNGLLNTRNFQFLCSLISINIKICPNFYQIF